MACSGIIICLFGPSGSGKTYWKKKLVEKGYRNIKSYTTREKRNENDDEYCFITNERWEELFLSNDLANINNYYDEMYGTSIGEFAKVGNSVVISDISSLDGVKSLCNCFNKQVKFVYCSPPSLDEIRERHEKRGTKDRIEIAEREIQEFDRFFTFECFRLKTEQDLNKLVDHISSEMNKYSWQNIRF